MLKVKIGLKLADGSKKIVIRSLKGVIDPDDKEPNETLEVWDKSRRSADLLWRRQFSVENLAKIAGEENATRAWVDDVCVNGNWGKDEDEGYWRN